MTSQTITANPPKGKPLSEAELKRLESIIDIGRDIKRLRTELKAHDAKRDRYRVMLVERIEKAELQLAALADGPAVERALAAPLKAVRA